MTKKDMAAIGEELFKRKRGVIDGLTSAKNGFLEAGRNLMIIKQKKLFRAEGNHIISFSHWAENELGISKATAYQLIEVYEKFGDLLTAPEYAQIEYSKAAALTSMVKPNATLQDREALLSMAKDQSVRGLKDNLRELRGEKATDTCEHPPHEQQVWNRCGCCGKFWRD